MIINLPKKKTELRNAVPWFNIYKLPRVFLISYPDMYRQYDIYRLLYYTTVRNVFVNINFKMFISKIDGHLAILFKFGFSITNLKLNVLCDKIPTISWNDATGRLVIWCIDVSCKLTKSADNLIANIIGQH